jgi:pyrroloquinoline-quinone synthase
MVASNLADEEGVTSPDGRAHSDLWMDFARGMGADEASVKARALQPETQALISMFQRMTRERNATSALAALYAYESRVPAIAREKACGLKEHYGADAATTRYFTLHQTADVMHADVWRGLIADEVAHSSANEVDALEAMEEVATALWKTLDSIERGRQARKVPAAANA